MEKFGFDSRTSFRITDIKAVYSRTYTEPVGKFILDLTLRARFILEPRLIESHYFNVNAMFPGSLYASSFVI